MNLSLYGTAILAVLTPLLALFFPGITFIRLTDFRDLLLNGARVILWSLSIGVLGSLIITALGAPVVINWLLIAVISAWYVFRRRAKFFCMSCGWAIMAIIAPITLLFGAFSVPYLAKHGGLPTGDSQKAIFWAQNILDHTALPNYGISPEHLNRDPGDFFTPGLHTLTAQIMSISAYPLMTVGFFAIALGAALAWIAAAISKEVFHDKGRFVPPLLTALFVLTNIRFLRYLREPGYHFQNLVGEVLLFGLLLIGLRLLRRFSWGDMSLAIVMAMSLVVSHQFSVFVGFFALLPLALLFIVTHPSKRVRSIVGVGVLALLVLAVPFGLYSKLPHLFTSQAHLSNLTPSLISYPLTMGTVWFLFGIAGLVLLLINAYRTKNIVQWASIGAVIAILILSQGPRIFLDIPPVRALFYSVVPLSFCAAYFVTLLHRLIQENYRGWPKVFFTVLIIVFVAVPTTSSTVRAYQTSTHASAPNSTLTADLEFAASRLSHMNGNGVLIDDYNRRAASWLILSGKPMFTRIAADISRQMGEAGQSPERLSLYTRQLNYEKIFSLSSSPLVATLMDSENISFISAVDGKTADGFSHNPALLEVLRAGKSIIFTKRANVAVPPVGLGAWLLRTSTLVNDIGDDADTFQHLPASIRAPRLSGPQFDGHVTFRTTTAENIPLEFNVEDYVTALWDKDGSGQPDTSLELLVQTTFGPKTFTVRTESGAEYTLKPGIPLKLNPEDISATDKGHIRLTIVNPSQSLVGIDLIALGLARTP